MFGGLGIGTQGRPGAHGGGAELQMAVLAQGLAEQGLSVALIVWPVERREGLHPNLDLVLRPAHVGGPTGKRVRFGKIREAINVWRGCAAANASIYVYRGGGPLLFVLAAYCRLRRRKLVFSAANDLDFDFDRPDRSRSQRRLYERALPRADLIVAQREEQLELARRTGFENVTMIRSSAQPADPSTAEPEAFIWIGRLVDYKRPLRFEALAEAVPEARFRMVWFSTDESRPGLIREIEAAGSRLPNLELLGQLSHADVLDLISRATALVSTSAAEGMPNVFLEAWARAIPVLSLDYDPDGKIEVLRLGLVAHGSDERFQEAATVTVERSKAALGARRERSRIRDRGAFAGRGRRALGRGSPSPASTWPRRCRGKIAMTLQSDG